jgi:hypothetical protein
LRRNCLLKHAAYGKVGGRIEVTGRRRRRRKQPHDEVKEKRGYCKLVDIALFAELVLGEAKDLS